MMSVAGTTQTVANVLNFVFFVTDDEAKIRNSIFTCKPFLR
jgi:hypothetical protein